MVYNNVLEAMGNTPLIKLQRMTTPDMADIIVKFEAINVGGSVKTRTAYNMITEAEKRGEIKPGSIIAEPTSGNQGIGMALVGAVKGYKVIIVMPDSVSEERRKLVEAYGAEVRMVHDEGDIGKAIDDCLATVMKIKEDNPNVFVPQQFINPDNPDVHRKGTGAEILADIDRQIDGFCSGFGTGGTLTGIGEVLKAKNPDIMIWALEPENAAILAGGKIGSHIQMGIGDGLIPENLNTSIYSDTSIVTDEEALAAAKRLAREEGLMVGISSGTNVVGAMRMAKILGPGKTVVTLCPDTAERYFSTPLFD